MALLPGDLRPGCRARPRTGALVAIRRVELKKRVTEKLGVSVGSDYTIRPTRVDKTRTASSSCLRRAPRLNAAGLAASYAAVASRWSCSAVIAGAILVRSGG